MLYKNKITIGVLPIKRGFLSLDVAAAEKERLMNTIQDVKKDNVTLVTIDDISERGVLCNPAEVDAVVDKFKANKIDALFICHCDFGTEEVAAKVAREFKDVPVLLWGDRDKYPNTFEARGRDTQCGMFACTKVLLRNGVTFSYIYNVDTESEEFMNGYVKFLRVVSIVKAMKKLKIAQIGARPQAFMSVIASEAAMLETFGIEVVPFSVTTIIDRVLKMAEEAGEEVMAEVADYKARIDCAQTTEDGLKKLAALKLTVKDMMLETGCRAAALECWSLFSRAIGVSPCFLISEFADMGYPVACETDLNGALTSVIAQAAALDEKAVFFADLTIRHPENDNAELLWHCGPFPYSLRDTSKPARLVGGQATWELQKGDITIVRCDELNGKYKLIAAEGKAVDGPETTGSYVWFEAPDWKRLEEKFIYGPYIHHVAGVYGKYADAIQEAARYLPVEWDDLSVGPRSL